MIDEILAKAPARTRPPCWWPRNEWADPERRRQFRRRYDYLIVGAGFAGRSAERLASQHDARVLLIDRRPHVGGNAYDEPNEAGILYHKYARTSSTPTAHRSWNICRSSQNGGHTSIAFEGSFAASWSPSRSTGRRSICCSTSTSRPTSKRLIISPRGPSRSTKFAHPKMW